ncbi:MAG: hypothetical protein NVS4B6_29580 [Mycobacterium sp.]
MGALVALASVTWLLVVPAAMAAAQASTTSAPAARAVRWGFLIGLGVDAVILILGLLCGARVTRLFVGFDGRVSTSKTIAAVWTLLVAAVLFGVVYANLLNHPQALDNLSSGSVGQYAVLFGGPLGAAILAKGIVTSQVNDDPRIKTPGSASAIDLIADDHGDVDLGDFQYVLFNGVALFYVVSTLLHAPLNGLPHIPDVLLGLTSVAAVGYVGKKALNPPAPTGGAATPAVSATGAPTAAVTQTDADFTFIGIPPVEDPDV